ncbi:hypothetical protein [Planctomyces sp. SH-PL14]|uniref:hypothetical protein n=1 Tax=Planctomyces sp. SH-PL14 TaxID=1632864 RepID=UPI00078ED4AD|nr:hypothetical protein [Planctomyces sp. SH-PL14]AMV20488.1 hypothetical protein VT03_21500 [Planctomyces sp. SH-PL14]
MTSSSPPPDSEGARPAAVPSVMESGPNRGPASWWWKLPLSAAILYHLAAIVLAPASISPSSALIRETWRGVGHYLQFVNLNHGSHFFAPDPGPATLVRYTAKLPSGEEVKGQIPDRTLQWPRLLYHRHFMLTEFLASSRYLDPRIRPLHVRALARQILRSQGADEVTLEEVTHQLPQPEWVRSGFSLNDPELFEVQPIGRFERGDF